VASPQFRDDMLPEQSLHRRHLIESECALIVYIVTDADRRGVVEQCGGGGLTCAPCARHKKPDGQSTRLAAHLTDI